MQSKGIKVALVVLSGLMGFLVSTGHAQEICGLQDAVFDESGVLFADGFEPGANRSGSRSATRSIDLGPPVQWVDPPALGVAPIVTITSPAPSAVLPQGRVQLAGTVTGPVNTGVSVGGLPAYVHDGLWLTPEFAIDGAATELEVTATTLDGLTASASVAISVDDAEPDARFTTATPVGFSPLPALFRVELKDGLSLETVTVDFDGDGQIDYTGTSPGDLPLFTYPQPGTYTATATLTLAGHAPIIVTHRVLVLSLAEQRTQVCATYAHLRARLMAQDAEGAGQALMGKLRSRLMPLFDALAARMPEVAAKLGTLADGTIGMDGADIISVREQDNELHGFPTHFARDEDGVWRVDSM